MWDSQNRPRLLLQKTHPIGRGGRHHRFSFYAVLAVAAQKAGVACVVTSALPRGTLAQGVPAARRARARGARLHVGRVTHAATGTTGKYKRQSHAEAARGSAMAQELDTETALA